MTGYVCGVSWLRPVYLGMTERNEISAHEVRVFTLFEGHPTRWFTHRELAEEGKAAPRTVRAYTVKLVRLGLLDVAEVWPGHRYRLREKPEKRNTAYHQRLKAAQAVFSGK